MLPKFLKPKVFINLIRLGGNSDGGYFVPKKNLIDIENLISCGLGFNWNFEKDFIKQNKKAKLFVFDHTINLFSLIIDLLKSLFFSLRYRKDFNKIFKIYDYYNFFSNYAIHKKIKITNKNSKKKEINLDNILKNKEKIFLKVDIEGDEYKILNVIKKNQKNIISLVIEFHQLKKNLPKIKKFYKNLNLISCNLCPNNSSGVDIEGDPNTIEVTYINRYLLKKNDFKKDIGSKCLNNNPYKKKIIIKYKK